MMTGRSLEPADSLAMPCHSARGLADVARRWGYGCDVDAADDDAPLAEGVLSTLELSYGMRVCATDLVATRDNERAGIIARTLTIVLVLDGDPIRYALDGGEEQIFWPGRAAMVTAVGDARLSGRHRRGERSRSLVLQANPRDMDDDALGAHVERRLAETALAPLRIGDRLQALAHDLMAAHQAGPIARLLAESCALELLARGLAAEQSADSAVHPRDANRVLRVRDKLIAAPAEDHRLGDLARLAGMSVSSLKAKFPRVVGQSVFDFLRSQRLEHARRGLECEGWTVKQAAHFVGYAHPSNFAAAYRRKFGSPPRDARGA